MAAQGSHTSGRRLSLVPGQQTCGLTRPPARISFSGGPWRPGELPGVLWIELPAAAAADANELALEQRVPVEVWLRATIDGARVLDELTVGLGRERRALARTLDREASTAIERLGPGGPLAEYARLLARGEPGSASAILSDGRVELSLPPDLELAWQLAASGCGENMQRWVAARATRPIGHPLRWEAAAAAAGQRLAEWTYACLLIRSSAASASPQVRT